MSCASSHNAAGVRCEFQASGRNCASGHASLAKMHLSLYLCTSNQCTSYVSDPESDVVPCRCLSTSRIPRGSSSAGTRLSRRARASESFLSRSPAHPRWGRGRCARRHLTASAPALKARAPTRGEAHVVTEGAITPLLLVPPQVAATIGTGALAVTESRTFDVSKYVLPTFSVRVPPQLATPDHNRREPLLSKVGTSFPGLTDREDGFLVALWPSRDGARCLRIHQSRCARA